MRPGGLTIRRGGAPSAPELAALCAAVAALLDDEAAVVATDPIPAAYRSAWRSEGIRESLDGGARA